MSQSTLAPIRRTEVAESPEIRGVVRLTPQQLRFQRRMTLLFTVGPLAGIAFAVWSLWGTGISSLDLSLFLGFYALTGLGITVGYHRLFTHRSFRATKPIRVVLAVAGSMAVEGSVISWCATHRRHHAFADRFGDPHSPHLAQAAGVKGVLIGLWHAHLGWMLREERSDPNEWTPDLVADPAIQRVDRAFSWLTVATFLLPAAIGFVVTGTLSGAWSAFIWGSLVRVFLLHHVTWSINSICHFYGKEAYRARDESRNVWPMAPISFGESWHNNHHAFPWSARLGLRAWQIDLGWYAIAALRSLGLVRDVKVPTREQREARRIR
ncbi:MAG TPA: fatty acid desaturase [Actinomycetota bacterium]|nr:fatty acid desaturase [Actinomycetota bacterium]